MDLRTSDHRAWRRRPSVLVAAGALPLIVAAAAAGPAAAATAAGGPDRPPAVYQTPSVRDATRGFRPAPTGDYLAPVDVGALHLPGPVAAVAPIEPPRDMLRLGDVVVGIPPWLNREQATQVNDAAAQAEARAATLYDAIGIDPSRSDRMAARTVGGAVAGVGTGAAVAIPLAMAAGLIGGVVGFGVGIPMMPAGLVFMPAICATLGAGMVTSTFALAGGTVGALAGAAAALAEPPVSAKPVSAKPVSAKPVSAKPVSRGPITRRPADVAVARVVGRASRAGRVAGRVDAPEAPTPSEDLVDTIGGRAMAWVQHQPLAAELLRVAAHAAGALTGR